jgi:flagellar biosynthesis protein FlhF
MQYFTEQAGSQGEAIRRIKDKYGESARILTHRTVRLPGFLGIFSKEGVEVTGYISEDSGAKQIKNSTSKRRRRRSSRPSRRNRPCSRFSKRCRNSRKNSTPCP